MKPVKVGIMPFEQYKKYTLSRTLKNFQRHRIVDLILNHRRKRPVALATEFDILIGREHAFDHKSTRHGKGAETRQEYS